MALDFEKIFFSFFFKKKGVTSTQKKNHIHHVHNIFVAEENGYVDVLDPTKTPRRDNGYVVTCWTEDVNLSPTSKFAE